jgi:putative copper export protein
VNDVVHLAAGAVWFSGIVLLASVLPYATRGLEGAERLKLTAPIVSRFSWVALVSIGVVALTGTFNSLFNVESPGDLVDSGYGQLLSAKILAFIGVLALGAINHFYVRRRLEAAARDSATTRAQSLFRKTIAIELALALLLMGLTGFLVGSARTRPSAAPAAPTLSSR